jgi:hypothetical protein
MVLISAEDNRSIFRISLRSAVYQIRHFETTHWKSKAVYPELHLFYKGKIKTGAAKSKVQDQGEQVPSVRRTTLTPQR